MVSGRLEVPCKIIVKIFDNIWKQYLLRRYENLLKELYIEPII